MTRYRRVRVTVAAMAVLGCVAGAGISLATTSGEQLAGSMLSVAVVVSFAVVGAVVMLVRPANPVGWLMLGGAAAWAVGGAALSWVSANAGSSAPAVSVLVVGGSVSRSVGWLLVTVAVAVLFPDGQVLSVRWRWLPRLVIWAVAVTVAGTMTAADANVLGLPWWRNPMALPGWGQQVSSILSLSGVALAVAATVGAVTQMVARWRQGGPLVRSQLGLAAGAWCLPIAAAPLVLAGVAQPWLFGATALPIPYAIGFAVLARGLYDLRTATNRVLVWAAVSVALAVLYGLVIAGVGALLHSTDAVWLPWAAAGVVAVSFAPVRAGLQALANRVVFGRWEQPREVLAGFGQRLAAAADVSLLLEDLLQELAALGLTQLAIVTRDGDLLVGDEATGTRSRQIPLHAYGEVVGSLRYGDPPGGLRQRDRDLLQMLAVQLGSAVYAYHVTDDLRIALQRTVQAREEERRRLSRDLHDGLGPAIAAQILTVDLAAAQAGVASPAHRTLTALAVDLQRVVVELRRIIDGLRPVALDSLGLYGALNQLAAQLSSSTGPAIQVCVQPALQLDAATEVAVFRIASEAMTNTVRHAHAATCQISIHRRGDSIVVQVRDDGYARPDPTPGHGLTGMRERATELRGTLEMTTGATGTTVQATLPLAAPGVVGP